jgi:LSD1 subclass zinc finger protein
MSRISSCPKCARLVTLPQGADPDAHVRCPLCDAEYRLADAMAGMPPELMIVGAAAGAADQAMGDAVQFDPEPLDLPAAADNRRRRAEPIVGEIEVDEMGGDDLPDFSSEEFDAGEIDLTDSSVEAPSNAPLGGHDFFRAAPDIDDELELDDAEPTELDLPAHQKKGKDFDFGKSSGASPTISPVKTTSGKSRKRKETSAIGNLIGVVGGGVIGLSPAT